MAAEIKKEIELEIAHVLFIDIVGYSKLSINDQRAAIDELTQAVRTSEQFQNAEAAARLIKIPTGDGMALVFYKSPEEPVECALEISRALKEHPTLQLRMGAHSGPVSGVIDVNGQANLAGAGLNMAQRVMACGDAGHILLSKRVGDDLGEYEHWRPFLHDLGFCEVKHGVKLQIVNLCTDEAGNRAVPAKLRAQRQGVARTRWILLATSLVLLAAVVAAFVTVSRRAARSSSAVPEKSIAVLPFENLSRDPDNAYFATGIQDEILTRLAKIAALKVISRTSTQQYAARPGNLSEIARQLGVAHVLEGSVQKAGDQVHINAQLIRAATDEHLWAESYDRKVENIFGVEGEVATSVVEALKAKLTAAEQHALEEKLTDNPKAYDAYLRGIALFRLPSGSRAKAINSFEEAVRLDPDFAAAWALLARVNSMVYFGYGDGTPARRLAAQRSLETALRLQPDLAEVQLAQAFYQYWVVRDFDGARRGFERLRAKLPNSADIPEALGMIIRRLGKWDESQARIDDALALSPRDRVLWFQAAAMRQARRDFSAALRCYDQALNIWPDDMSLISGKATLYQELGDLDQADALLAGLLPAEDGSPIDAICNQAILRRRYPDAIRLLQTWLDQSGSLVDRGTYRLLLGDLERLSGDTVAAKNSYLQARTEWEQILKEQRETTDWISEQFALIYAGLGDRELALKYAERATSLTPASKDATLAPMYDETRARIAARFGQSELALSTLERLLKIPYFHPLTPALLRLDPDFDLLRGDPRFQKLVASPAPK